MSLEVPIIIIIIAIPVYFLSKRVLEKRKIGNKKSRKYVAIIPSLILSSFIYIGLIAFWMFSESYYSRNDFNQEEWRSNIEERYKMSENIIESKMLVGKSRDEVINLLGTDFSTYNENHIAYYIGFVPGFFNIAPDVLDIYFENNKVIKVKQHET